VGSSLTFGAIPVGGAGSGGTHGWGALDDFTNAVYYTSATWTSDIFDAVTVSSWTTFDASASENGGSISYAFRTGTSNGAVQAAAWTTITPGAIINSSVDSAKIQVQASLYSDTGLTVTPRLDDVSVSYTQGGTAANKLWLGSWKNRLWVAASSGTATTTNNIVLVKSRLPLNSFMPYGLQIGAMVRYGDAFYAAASTHSAIYRMDYGTNDNGAAIPWFWESRDELWGAPNNQKQLREMNIDFKKGTAANAYFGYSRDYGTTYYDKAVSMSGSGRGSSTKYVNGGQGFSYRFRFGSSTLDETATVTGFSAWAHHIKKRE